MFVTLIKLKKKHVFLLYLSLFMVDIGMKVRTFMNIEKKSLNVFML